MSGRPSRARRAIRRVRPHLPQTRCGRSAHRAQNGRPCPSRPATGLTTPHRVHAVASCRRRQRAHTPPAAERVSGLPVRPHRPQAGSGRSTPRARSSSTRRPTAGGAPTVSASGSAVQGRGQRPDDRRVAGHRVDGVGQHLHRDAWRCRDGGDDPDAPATAAQPPLGAGWAASLVRQHGVSVAGSGSTRARVGRGGAVPVAGSRRADRGRVAR